MFFFLWQARSGASSTACCWTKRTPVRKRRSSWRQWKVGAPIQPPMRGWTHTYQINKTFCSSVEYFTCNSLRGFRRRVLVGKRLAGEMPERYCEEDWNPGASVNWHTGCRVCVSGPLPAACWPLHSPVFTQGGAGFHPANMPLWTFVKLFTSSCAFYGEKNNAVPISTKAAHVD